MRVNLERIACALDEHFVYRKIVSELKTASSILKSFEFEAVFAYSALKSGLVYRYEVNINPKNSTSVDFVYEYNADKILCFELVRPEMSDELKTATTPRKTESEGVTYFEVFLESGHPKEHFRPQAQTIRLQEKLLEKVEKFPEPNDSIFCTIVVDCSEFHFGQFDSDDSRMVMYGKTLIPAFQEFWGRKPILGLLDHKLEKRMAPEFRRKITAVIFIPSITENLLEGSFMILNYHRAPSHLKEYCDKLTEFEVFHGIKILKFPRFGGHLEKQV